MALQIGVYTQPEGSLLLDLSARRAQDTQFSTNEYGFSNLSSFVPMSLEESFYFYERPLLPYVVAYGEGAKVWDGRLEDVSIVNGGISLTAFGHWRSMFDVPYTAVWSTTSYREWFVMDDRQIANNTPDRYNFDTDNRLYITPRKNSVLGNTTAEKRGRLGFALPHRDTRGILRVAFDWAFFGASSSWRVGLNSHVAPYPVTGAWTSATSEWSETGDGTEQTGSEDITFSPTRDGAAFFIDFNAADATYTSETGTDYLKITNLRVKTTASASVFADEIADALLAHVDSVNSGLISTSDALIQSPGLDLENEVYQDLLPGDILKRLVKLGDDQTPPRRWEVGVFGDRILHLRPRGDVARDWFVDVSAIELERTIETLTNSVYAVYADESGRKLRTSNASDQDSIDRFGLTRRRSTSVDTSDTTQAETHRGAVLENGKDPPPRSSVLFNNLYDASGGLWPNYSARSGDTITIRNLSPTASTEIDKIRTFTILETTFHVDQNVLEVVPELPIPTFDSIIAKVAGVARVAAANAEELQRLPPVRQT